MFVAVVTLGQIHFVLAIAAIASGGAAVLMRKGTGAHRLIGFIYAVAMIGMLGTAFLIYNLTGTFGPFHVLAIFSLATLLLGLVPVLLRKPGNQRWIELHAFSMSWSYVGLLAAAAAETLTRIPDTPFWGGVGFASGSTIAIGAAVIHRMVPRTLHAQFPKTNATPIPTGPPIIGPGDG
jgi:uncharacterized membrane protein